MVRRIEFWQQRAVDRIRAGAGARRARTRAHHRGRQTERDLPVGPRLGPDGSATAVLLERADGSSPDSLQHSHRTHLGDRRGPLRQGLQRPRRGVRRHGAEWARCPSRPKPSCSWPRPIRSRAARRSRSRSRTRRAERPSRPPAEPEPAARRRPAAAPPTPPAAAADCGHGHAVRLRRRRHARTCSSAADWRRTWSSGAWTARGSRDIAPVPGAGRYAFIVGNGDYDGDGLADILWRDGVRTA